MFDCWRIVVFASKPSFRSQLNIPRNLLKTASNATKALSSAHVSEYSARAALYDDEWMERQEDFLKSWIQLELDRHRRKEGAALNARDIAEATRVYESDEFHAAMRKLDQVRAD